MKKIILSILCSIPMLAFSQASFFQVPGDTTKWPLEAFDVFLKSQKGDTIVNLNTLNNGIIKYQISDESTKILVLNGLEIKEGGNVVVVNTSLLKKDFSFDVKTFASDKEWYENTIKVKVNYGKIKLINVASDKIEMATGMRKDGKIYVVIAVSMILFFVIIFYLVFLERKVKKLENRLKN